MFDNLPNINYLGNKNPIIESDTSDYELPFYKDIDYFVSIENFVNFVKACERLVRTSDLYTKYKRYLMVDLGMTKCQVLSNIDSNDTEGHNDLIEMHHGPVLTLFDITSIVIDHLLAEGKGITTFSVADIVLQEHFNNNIQIVMLSKTIHEQVHERNIFINYKQGFGDLDKFLKKYKNGLTSEQINKIKYYIERSKKEDSVDNGVLKLSGFVQSWSDENSI